MRFVETTRQRKSNKTQGVERDIGAAFIRFHPKRQNEVSLALVTAHPNRFPRREEQTSLKDQKDDVNQKVQLSRRHPLAWKSISQSDSRFLPHISQRVSADCHSLVGKNRKHKRIQTPQSACWNMLLSEGGSGRGVHSQASTCKRSSCHKRGVLQVLLWRRQPHAGLGTCVHAAKLF